MTDLKCFTKLMNGQMKKYVKTNDYSSLAFTLRRTKEFSTGREQLIVDVDNIEVGFVFSGRGRLVGAFNYKQ